MKNKQLNKEEQALSDKLNELNFEYNAADWEAIQDRLPSSGKSSLISGKSLIGIAAVAIVLVGSVYYLNSEKKVAQNETTEQLEVISNDTPLNKEQNEETTAINTNKKSEEIKNEPTIESSITKQQQAEPYEEPSKSESVAENKVDLANDTENDDKQSEKVATNQEKPIVKVQESFQLLGLNVPSKICPGSSYIIEVEANSTLPKNWTIDWIFDGQILSKGSNVEGMEVQENGTEKVAIQIRNEKGEIVHRAEQSLRVVNLELHDVDFTYSDSKDPYTDLQLSLKANSSLSNSFVWKGEDGKKLGEGAEFQYHFKEKGVYDITLLETTAEGCMIEKSKPVSVEEDFDPLAPNAFSPDQDGTNDHFIPKGFAERDDRFKMEIFNLAGDLIYRGHDNQLGWNGQLNNSGAMMPEGIYVWKVSISNNKGQSRNFAGNLRLMINQ